VLDAVAAGGRDEGRLVLRRAVGAGVNMEKISLEAGTAFGGFLQKMYLVEKSISEDIWPLT
jgi:hypothetical protein